MLDLDSVLFVQSYAAPLWDAVFIFFSALGVQDFYLAAIPLIYWCLDRPFGVRLAVFFSASMDLNGYLKDLFALPRPGGANLRIVYQESGTGYGFPSGHAQGSTTFWGYLAYHFKKPWLTLLAVAVIALVSLSRVYLGLHFPADVLGGVAIGLAILGLITLVHSRDWESANLWRYSLSLVVPLLALLLYSGDLAYTLAGSVTGTLWGYWALGVNFPKAAKLTWQRQLFKIVLGLLLLTLVRYGLKPLLSPLGLWGDYLRYLILGFLAYGPMLLIFKKFNLE